jgi:HSP20 family protein
MALPQTQPRSWFEEFPNRLFASSSDDYDLYEEDDEFVLSVELPGYSPEEMTVTWDEGVLNIAAEHTDDARGEQRAYHRRFRFPKSVDESEIYAQYDNGILDVRLPILTETGLSGTEIEIEG